MKNVVILSTGGTISARAVRNAGAQATDLAAQLAARITTPDDVAITARDVFVTNSFLLTATDMLSLAYAVRETLQDPAVTGVVITHGTDTLEESAFLVDLVHTDDRPVVLTGAQRPADAGDTDGPRNLADAVTVASDSQARGLGTLIVFDGQVYPARGTRKTHTLRPSGFTAPDGGPIGQVSAGELVVRYTPIRPKPVDLGSIDLHGVRVDIASFYPGADSAALEAFGAAGANGIVLQASGAGNANEEIVQKVAALTRQGVVVGLSTRVDAGPVAALYGNGGGVDLVKAGANPMGILRPPQARILLITLLGALQDPDRVREELRHYI